MVKRKEKELTFLTEEEIEEKINNHLLFINWKKWIDNTFNWYYFWWWVSRKWTKDEKDHEIDTNIFSDRILNNSNFDNSSFGYLKILNTDFKEASFKNTDLKKSNFSNILNNLEWADFRWAKYSKNTFSKKQLQEIINTDKKYLEYQERIKKENKELKVKLNNTSNEQTKILISSFVKLEKQFLLEEKRWLFMSFIIFISLFLYFLTPILDLFSYEYMPKILVLLFISILWLILWTIILIFTKDKKIKSQKKIYLKIWTFKIKNIIKDFILISKNLKVLFCNSYFNLKKIFLDFWTILIVSFFLAWILSNIPNSTQSLLTWEVKYILLPLGFLLSTFLYFSLYQYSKSKKLRIENSNKVALLHWYIAIKSEKWDWMDKWRFYDKVADVVFSKVYEWKENNLPVDKIIDIIKLIK